MRKTSREKEYKFRVVCLASRVYSELGSVSFFTLNSNGTKCLFYIYYDSESLTILCENVVGMQSLRFAKKFKALCVSTLVESWGTPVL